jgi:predicted porin
MRKILLATAAGFAAFVADGAAPAMAQAGTEVTGQATPQPGLVPYVQGRYRFFGAFVSQDGDSGNNTTATDNFVIIGLDEDGNPEIENRQIPGNNRNKLGSFDFFDYGRIWVGADGVAANGLRYGARLEIRMPGSGARGDGRGSLFFRRIVGYVGTPTLGQLRFGSGTVTAVEQMHVGHIMGSIGTGLLDGDGVGNSVVGTDITATSFFYSNSLVNNRTAIGYFSPQFFGFDLGLSYSPNDGNFLGSCSPGATAASFSDCDRLSSTSVPATATTAGPAARLRNQFDAMLRYRGTFGPVGLAASGGVRTAETVDFTGAPAPNGAPFKRATAYLGGAQVTWAGLTVGGIMTGGPYNRGFTALPKNGNNSDAFSWQLGASYRFGAFTVGAAYHQLKTEGSRTNPADQKDQGFGVGGSWAVAPGMALFAEYNWSKVRESGRDLNPVEVGTQDTVKAQVFLLGIGFQW